jgi:hypothetical protein
MLWAELHQVYNGPVVQTQDLTVINITKEAVVSRQANVVDQLPPIAGHQCVSFTPKAVPPPAWSGGRRRSSRSTEFRPSRVERGGRASGRHRPMQLALQ